MRRRARVDMSVEIGSVRLANPIMTASGTAGVSVELSPYMDLSTLGAVVVKSLAPFAWPGNPGPRLAPVDGGMLNAVGLQGPGLQAWLTEGLVELLDAGAVVVASIWGRSVDEYRAAAQMLSGAPGEVVAVEVNLSCPNLNKQIIAHDPVLSAEVVAAVGICGRPMWAKLSPNTDRLVEIATAVRDAGAESVTLINTVGARILDPADLGPALGNGSGGLSGRSIHPVAVRAIHEVRRELPDLAIVGAGGVSSGWDAAELMITGAQAVQVGTATFADPRAPVKVLRSLESWCSDRHIPRVSEISALG
jgi:dihydroorotate dehydrogenase (NAD+) catalytic subunit